MLLSVLLLQLVSTTEASFYGYVFSYTTKLFQGAGYQVVRCERFSFASCREFDSWFCGGDCSYWKNIQRVDQFSDGGCQTERISKINNASFSSSSTMWSDRNWTDNKNGILSWTSLLTLELRNRSDISKPNSSPQTTILPTLRVPSNCQRNISLLTFDPDGDAVRCRYAAASRHECSICTPPLVLSLFSSCTLSFSPTNSSNEGPYAVQLTMEDFPRQTMTLTDSVGGKVVRTTSSPITGIPIQFILTVDPAAPSCAEGLYLPRFLPPTPDNGIHIVTVVNQTVMIPIKAEATQSVITGIVFSGPYNVIKCTSRSGIFTLRWTPSLTQVGESHPICFVVTASFNSSVFESELRCVVVTVIKYHAFYLKMNIATSLPLENNMEMLQNAIKGELVRRIPSVMLICLLGDGFVKVITTPSSSGSLLTCH
ncbi:uncharacterized protein [Nothobranchius furzeri]|uniref:LOC107395575-like protein n=1 Tax=Nothobranchius furzeri TaxID=105023 RepID=A0A9D2Z3D8_NOTFU|nr:putative LOC107395575-like protein [Nothobranchius furzeri]